MNTWLVEIVGLKHELELLRNLVALPDLNIKEDDGKYYLRSSEFDSYKSPRQVLIRSKPLLNLINGIAILEGRNWTKFKPANVISEDINGKKAYFLIAETGKFTLTLNDVKLTLIRADGTIVTDTIVVPSLLEYTLISSSRNSSVQKALRMYSTRELNWVNLYIILEVIESDLGGKNVLVSNGWISNAKIKNFKHTANSVGAIGDEARHGKEITNPPTKPMPLKEAKVLIEILLKQWISSK